MNKALIDNSGQTLNDHEKRIIRMSTAMQRKSTVVKRTAAGIET